MISEGVGPSDRIRTCGILLPKQARYQLRYTRTVSYTHLDVYKRQPIERLRQLVPDDRHRLRGIRLPLGQERPCQNL